MAIYKKQTGVNAPVPYTTPTQKIVPLTWAQYQALTQAEQMNGTIYRITDRNAYIPSANMVDYDNTQSGMTATKVQGAIDELNSDLSELKYNGLSGYIDLSSYTSSNRYTFPCDGYLQIYASTNEYVHGALCGSHTAQIELQVIGASNGVNIQAIYVRKGMRAYLTNPISSNCAFRFAPFIE